MTKLSSVLLVDDDPTTNFLNQLLLRQMAVAEELRVAENGAEALRTLAQAYHQPEAGAAPALILLDVNMPVMTLAFLEAYAQLAPLPPPLPVIVVLTTSMHQPELARIQALPVAAIVSKPLTREKVLSILQTHFSAA